MAAITKSPISIHITGAKELTETRSVTIGPWKNAKSTMMPRATATKRTDFPGLGEIKPPGEPGPVVLGGQPAAGGHHCLGRLGPPGAVLIAVTAVIAQPGFGRLEQLVLQPQLNIAIYLAWKRIRSAGQWTRCTAGATLHADFHIPGAEFCQLAIQVRNQHRYCYSSVKPTLPVCENIYLVIILSQGALIGLRQCADQLDEFLGLQRFL